ncbi:MAG: AP2/ERF family transcription factor [Sulfuricurvum sp.]
MKTGIQYKPNELIGVCNYLLEAEKKGKHRYAFFKCPICSSTFTAKIDHIKAKRISNCGCVLKRESHNKGNTRIYHIWEGIKQRCLNPKNPNYPKYGGAGITLVDEWKRFSSFEAWSLANGYTDLLSIDRIDNLKGYNPDNCRWATLFTQHANKQFLVPNKAGFTGVEISKGNNFTARLRVNGKRVNLGTFITAKEAALIRDAYIKKHKLHNKLNFP